MFNKMKKITLDRESAAKLLKTTPGALEAFEASYRKQSMEDQSLEGFFDRSAKQAKELRKREHAKPAPTADCAYPAVSMESLIARAVQELLAQCEVIALKDGNLSLETWPEPDLPPITVGELMALPKEMRLQATGDVMARDIEQDASMVLLFYWNEYLKERNPRKRDMYYNLFRQGLDIQDLDGIMYAMLGQNPNAMSKWLPALASANAKHGFFRIPDTRIMKVPMTLLQLSRKEYGEITEPSMKVLDEVCRQAFRLDPSRDYFVKTGTYSSKFDFRNAHVTAGKEVGELGQYLLYIQNQASMMAGPLSNPCIYGMSTTNEWCVRDYVPNTENLPCIYKGMPLRTEYRVFVDCDTKTVMGMSPYWRPDVMKQRLGYGEDRDDMHMKHDYVIYCTEEERLTKTYESNKGMVESRVRKMLPDLDLSGQWSLDVMQDGNSFYLIDMALATQSALNDCLPKELLRPVTEDWLPKIPER